MKQETIELTREEYRRIRDTLWAARCDIWQTARVSEYNLTGKDPNFPEDKPADAPILPKFVHRAGLDASYAVVEELSDTLKWLARKAPPDYLAWLETQDHAN